MSSSAGMLYVCATPIGNLGDISTRLAQVLSEVDIVLAEDTRVTRKLLNRLEISPRIERFDEHTSTKRIPEVLAMLRSGTNVALVSDAGTPCLSDPGQNLVAAARDEGLDAIVGIPGPSALTTAFSISGIIADALYFGGFMPRRHQERVTLLSSLAELPAALVFFESPHRIVSTLEDCADILGDRTAAIARELTKIHEEVVRLPLPELRDAIKARASLKGEFVLIIGPPLAIEKTFEPSELADAVATLVAQGASRSSAVKEVAAQTGAPKNLVYQASLGASAESVIL